MSLPDPPEDDPPEDQVWKALSDPTRRRVLDLLREKPRTTGELCGEVSDLCRTAVMKHLDVLEAAGLLLVRREGRLRWNYLNPVPIQEICERWLSATTSRRSASLLDLRRRAESRHARTKRKGRTRRTDNDRSRRRNEP